MACCCDWISDLAREHARRLVAIARHEGLGPADALDAVQDAFQTLMARGPMPPDDAARMLSTITRNAARNARRRHHRSKPHDELGDLASADRPDVALDRAEVRAQLATCMAKLGAVQRHVVTLRVLEELSGQEAADALGVTP